MNDEQLNELLTRLENSSIDEFELEQDDFKLKIKKNSQNVMSSDETSVRPQKLEISNKKEDTVVDEDLVEIKAPLVGVVYLSPAEDQDKYVEVGSKIKSSDTVCLIEAMKMFNEVHAEIDGEIVEVLVTNGTMVQYDQPLFKVRPNEVK
ncbi:acetyl-CoA carboxylase biotin carboxyl carrier protein [Pediococcus claussenii]|uniref:Biotin carboxyl carrier protein of acetyl-CoA carboxylase n=1 Tax=Pediococcus claussenii (strain ATCC BAA-344 / DSM 14800 / JCM 18046 / KCTC 3811 / LMG 21948 / P06) TaxID=701521 RepID=G8PEQ8_PEDCP|nr:biotin/lipoyl-containing protein [Pediococcus claussenii]AEV94438.1 acetyl-CoA carboxylase, biotin carboxyl carrier protein [Pediococcus claussenii ATCC BAA-344]ANZ69656.1 acetyl-CoA carboxylase biotin carboxyl carrier protein subunit [Pediococcus claussenii]ANZ71473.1 acetyl-CoA carboxylase biotin carboxyl carrier protein subunit [Pediococcus claussenii]KRN19858.1 accB protein [Pediococcus claussenii]